MLRTVYEKKEHKYDTEGTACYDMGDITATRL